MLLTEYQATWLRLDVVRTRFWCAGTPESAACMEHHPLMQLSDPKDMASHTPKSIPDTASTVLSEDQVAALPAQQHQPVMPTPPDVQWPALPLLLLGSQIP